MPFNRFDRWLMSLNSVDHAWLPAGFWGDFLVFGVKEARACLFAGLFFLAAFAQGCSACHGMMCYCLSP